MFDLLPSPLDSILAFVIVLGVLVFIHELGHYLAARWCGVHVEVFSIGFGRPIASWIDRQGTVWKLAWIPLGGYVKMHGQEQPADASDEIRAKWIAGRTFHEKSVGARSFVVAAGPLANFLLAAVLFAGLYAVIGRPLMPPVIGAVVDGSVAARAGLRAGDRIVAIDGVAVSRFEELQRSIAAAPGINLTLRLRRGAEELDVPVVPEPRDAGSGRPTGMLGIRNGAMEFEAIGTGSAVLAGVAQTWDVTVKTLVGLGQMISGKTGTEDLGGPLRIAQLSGQVAQLGFASLVSFIKCGFVIKKNGFVQVCLPNPRRTR